MYWSRAAPPVFRNGFPAVILYSTPGWFSQERVFGVERNTTYLNPAGRSERWSTFEGNRPNQYTVKPEVGSVMVTSPEGFLWYSSARIDRHQQYVLVATLTTTTYEESSKPVNRHVKPVVSKPLLATHKDAQRLTLLSSAISEVVQLLLRSTSYVRSL